MFTEIVINRPCVEVAWYAADPSHAPAWLTNIESVRWQTPPPVQVGSKMDFVAARSQGRRKTYSYEVVEFVPSERIVMRATSGPYPVETTYTWQPVDAMRTRMTLRLRGGPQGWGWILGWAAVGMRWATHKNLVKLKRLLER